MFETAFQFVTEQLGKNELLAGGAVLAVMMFIMNKLKTLPITLMYWTRLLFVTHIDIPDRSPSFKWVTDWLSEHKYTAKAKRVTIETRGRDNPEPMASPAPGSHLVWWGWTPIIIKRVRNESTGANAARAFREGWTISLVGSRKKVEKFVAECKKISRRDQDDFISVREVERGFWENASRRRQRPLSSVILPTDMSSNLLTDIKDFAASKEWYESMNIPWRRGYLLSGPPGNGKSSIIIAIASEINFEVYVVNLKLVEEDELVSLVSSVGEKAIILLEDVDCAFEDRAGKQGISMSTLLNCLDGVNATEGRVIFMTTNHPERLDPALIRPGRIDLHLELPNATEEQIMGMFNKFYAGTDQAQEFADQLAGQDISMAKLQGFFLQHKGSEDSAMDNLKDLFNN